ncbi:MAG TPA: alpha/beta fold hydrolase [Flavisolibacter sp.]|nr:alpha/beta fold hydrolase [Flavisolibacter sp.]
MPLQFDSHFLPIDGESVHLKRIYIHAGVTPVFFLHGSIEDGKIFYTNNGKGIAPYLALKGFDCFIIDLPGRGLSTPAIGKRSQHDLVFYIEHVIPKALSFIRALSGKTDVAVIAHSWGGVNMLATIAINQLTNIPAMVFFGTKRRISIFSLKKVVMIDLAWRAYGRALSWFFQYYPAKKAKLGSDNETIASFQQTDEWVRSKPWRYFKDNRDIAALLQQMTLPPILSITGKKDDVLGNPTDVQLLLEETGTHQPHQFILAAKGNGFQKDYDHINLLIDPKAVEDVYPKAYEWLKKYSG